MRVITSILIGTTPDILISIPSMISDRVSDITLTLDKVLFAIIC